MQVSSAIRASFDSVDDENRTALIEDLEMVAEDRYLHQSMIQGATQEQSNRFFDDLPLALGEIRDSEVRSGELRIHFHVPVYLSGFGRLATTQNEIIECLKLIRQNSEVKHYEVETYAWNVLPESLQRESLAVGIADEMQWFVDQMS